MQTHVISGYVGGNPETRQVGENSVTTISVAVNNLRNREAPATWYRVSCWNGLGKTLAQYVSKGDYVIVTGDRLKASAYINDNGKPSATLELTASGVDFSVNRKGQADQTEQPSQEEEIPF